MIVDDEILVRIGLRSTISWEEFGFTVIADAANGEQAIEKFAATDPDILITDIRMPGMDGIELIKNLKAIKPQLRTIILTNYDNFEYAKQAMKLGSDEYLLKTTLDNQTLLPVLKKLQAEINHELQQSQEYQQLQQKVIKGLTYQKKHFAERLITGKIENEEWSEVLKELGLKWEGHYFQLVLLKGKLLHQELDQRTQHSLKLIEEIVEKINFSMVWESPNSLEWLIIYNFSSEKEAEYYKQVIPFNIRQVKTCLKQYFQVPTIALFGKTVRDFAELPLEWQQVRKMLEYRFFLPEKELIFQEDILLEESTNCPLGVAEKNLTLFIRHGEREQVNKALEDLFEKVSFYHSPILLRQVCQELYSEISRLSREYGLQLTEILNSQEQHGDYLESLYSIQEVKEWFNCKFDLLITKVGWMNLKKYSPPIKQAISFIEDCYAQDISLLAVAQRVGLSKNHLCTLFHSEIGENFIDYLHRVRIRHACELLETTDMRVAELSLKLGYNDAKYFAKVFQKYQNCPPSEYRERCK
jgi:two-component system response regulator YesN